METTLVDKQAVKATVEVTVAAEQVDATFDHVLSLYSRQVRVPGFRPGKAPRGVLIRKIGEENLANEVREALIDEGYPVAVREHGLNAIHGHAHGGDPVRGVAFEFQLHVDLYPEFALPDLAQIVLDTVAEPIGEEQLSATVENLRREHATQLPVDRPAEAGDLVLVQTIGPDDQPREEGSTMPVDLETVAPALAEQLVGHGIDEVVELRVEDPSQRAEDGTPGSTTMRIRIADVKAKEKPDADDDFAKTLGFESWDEVLSAVRESLEKQAAERADEERREEFVEKLMEQTNVEVPAFLITRRKASLLENLTADLRQKGLDLDGYVEKLRSEGTLERFESELNESAERGAKRDLLLERLLEERPVEISDDEFREAVRFLAAREGMHADAFERERGEEWLTNYRFLLMRDRALRSAVDELVQPAPGG